MAKNQGQGAAPAVPTTAEYTILLGCNYPPDDTRSEVGDVVTVPLTIGALLVGEGAAELRSDTLAREKAAADALAAAEQAAKAAAGPPAADPGPVSAPAGHPDARTFPNPQDAHNAAATAEANGGEPGE